MSKLRYTEEHLEFLRDGYRSMNIRDLTKAFNARFGMGKTESQIKNTLNNHDIRCGRAPGDRLITRLRLYTEEQEQFIRNNYTGKSAAEMTAIFNSRFKANKKTLQQIKTFVHNRGITSGRTGCFPKGNKPWNTGTKGQGLTGPNRGSFKKGSVPPNRKPIGTERTCPKDGFILVKVAEPNPHTGAPTRYKHKHVYIWEQANGPVPKGMVVAFIDGEKTNCEPENLMLISRAELLALNRAGYGSALDKLKPSVLALSKLRVKTWEIVNRLKTTQRM